MTRILSLIGSLVLAALCGSGPVAAQWPEPAIVVTPGEGRAFHAAVQRFADGGSPAEPGRADALRSEIQEGMRFSDVLLPLADDAFLGPLETTELADGARGDCSDWTQGGADALVEGVIATSAEQLVVEFQVWDTARCRLLEKGELKRPLSDRLRLAKLLSDRVVAAFTGTPGVAGTEIAFISD